MASGLEVKMWRELKLDVPVGFIFLRVFLSFLILNIIFAHFFGSVLSI